MLNYISRFEWVTSVCPLAGRPRLAAGQLIPVIEELTPEVMALGDGKGSELGTGGMKTKLHAAEIATGAGIDMIIANGANPAALYNIADGKALGTRFLGKRK